MNWTYAVTFEKPKSQPPVTVRGEVEAGSAATATARAVRTARKQCKGQQFDSLLVLVERKG